MPFGAQQSHMKSIGSCQTNKNQLEV